mgnify:CR=1 FL=1
MNTSELKQYLDFGYTVIEEASTLALAHFREPLEIENKVVGSGFDPVTQADRAIEKLIRERIEANFPDHGIEGEEYAARMASGDLCWVVDPIDGTRAFMTGMTGWGLLLGLMESNKPVLGFMSQPYLGEVYTGSTLGANLSRGSSRQALRASQTNCLSNAVLYCTHPDMFADTKELENFYRLCGKVKLPRYGGDCYAYAMLAYGLVDLVVESDLKPCDILPLVPIIEAAGGVVSDIDGNLPLSGGTVVAASTRVLHDRAMAVMRAD